VRAAERALSGEYGPRQSVSEHRGPEDRSPAAHCRGRGLICQRRARRHSCHHKIWAGSAVAAVGIPSKAARDEWYEHHATAAERLHASRGTSANRTRFCLLAPKFRAQPSRRCLQKQSAIASRADAVVLFGVPALRPPRRSPLRFGRSPPRISPGLLPLMLTPTSQLFQKRAAATACSGARPHPAR
jgi:hypothetical protein